MSIFVQTIEGAFYKIADDPAKFQLETNLPFSGWLRITTEQGELMWFNSAHVIAIGELLENADETQTQGESNANRHN